ncbi:AMP-dependent synthetase/ligase [Cumulibacter soli]|uniref:AMP-dependent synthetase/ligase n=1 Tax=Cumulibacter soli TaxID=2546344 RepID=UPI0010677D47|nr:AMP-dependent synthetase/ligase [Cumulibacter soli]
MHEVSVPSLYDCPAQVNVADVVFDYAQRYPTEPAYARRIDGAWHDVTFAEFAEDVLQLARGLVAAGLKPGEHVGLMSHTRYEWGVIDFAVQAARGVVVPVYETSSEDQIEWILGSTDARFAFVENAELMRRVDGARPKLGALDQVFLIEDDALADLSAQGAEVPAERIAELRAATAGQDDATIVFTSGSTGRPKGCRLTHANLVSNARNAIGDLDTFIKPGSSTLLFLPLAHVFARIIQLGAFTARARVGHEADISALMERLAEFRPTFLLAVPRVFEKVYNSAEQKARGRLKAKLFDLASRTAITWSRAKSTGSIPPHVRLLHAVLDRLVGAKLRDALGGRCAYSVSGGAPLGERLGHFFRGVGIEVIEGYGMTETSPVAALNTPQHNKIGTVGRPIPGGTLRVADDGELLVRGPNVFKGYWQNDDETAATLRDGWLYTGDLAEIDAEGFVTITGRKKDLIVTAGGKNVAPTVLEDRLRAHPLVSQCIIVGDRRPFIGALITLDVEMLSGWLADHGLPAMSPDEAMRNSDVRAGLQRAVDYANKAVSRAEAIRKFEVLPNDFTVEGGQLTPSLKLRRPAVLAEFADDIDALYG